MSTPVEQIKIILKDTFPFLKEKDVNVLLEISKQRRMKNKEVFIKSGQTSQQLFFIINGMMRGYFINKKGEEKNIFLRPEHTLTGAPECLFHNQPTKYTFESILESDLLIFEKEDIQNIMQTHSNITKIYIEGLQENIMTLIFRVESLIDLTPAERYETLLTRSPQFFQTAFNKHIANYLGMTPVSLSRIIKRRKQSDS